MYWEITADHLVDGKIITTSRVGTKRGNLEDADGRILEVRLLDDDRELYYEAVADDEALEELYEWALIDAGAAILQVKHDRFLEPHRVEWRDEIS